MHLVEVEGDDTTADQVEQVAEGILLTVSDHQRRQDLPVQADRDRHLGQRGGGDAAVVPPGPPQQHQHQREYQVELHDHEQEVQLVVPGGGHGGQALVDRSLRGWAYARGGQAQLRISCTSAAAIPAGT